MHTCKIYEIFVLHLEAWALVNIEFYENSPLASQVYRDLWYRILNINIRIQNFNFYQHLDRLPLMFSSPQERTSCRNNLFLFLNTKQALKKLTQVIHNKSASIWDQSFQWHTQTVAALVLTELHLKSSIPKVNHIWHTNQSPRKPCV